MFAATEVRSVPIAALSTTPLSGQTFETVMGKVSANSALALPDQVVLISRLHATDDGFIEVPGVGTTSLTQWSRRQLAGILGIRWDRWFSEDLVVPADRAAEINLRFRRSSDSLKIRTRRWAADEEAKGDAVLRAFVSPTYAPIDDLNVFEALKSVLGGRLQELCFVRLDVTDESSQYAAVNRERCRPRNREARPPPKRDPDCQFGDGIEIANAPCMDLEARVHQRSHRTGVERLPHGPSPSEGRRHARETRPGCSVASRILAVAPKGHCETHAKIRSMIRTLPWR
jgi:hypothetical protein